MEQRQKDQRRNFPRKPRWVGRLISWASSPVFGYFAGILFVGALLLLERIDRYIPQAPLFIGAPFALVSILSALLWGIGPALLCFIIGLIALATFISPGIITSDLLKDTAILGPLILLQLVAIATVIRLERSHRGLLLVQRELETANQELLQATHLKDYVIMRASHELRTPLTTILGYTQLLASRLNKSGETPENWIALQKYREIVEIRARRLRTLIDSLFELSHVQAEEISPPLPLCDLGSLCQEIVENLKMISGRSIELELPTDAIMLPADDKRLSQVLENLVDNAIKYSPEDTIIHMRVVLDDTQATLQIHNEGIALSPEQIEHLFEPFYRTSGMEYSPIPGWGLGLTISKEIVEQHRGRIRAESSPGNGITFFVQLPLQTDTQ